MHCAAAFATRLTQMLAKRDNPSNGTAAECIQRAFARNLFHFKEPLCPK